MVEDFSIVIEFYKNGNLVVSYSNVEQIQFTDTFFISTHRYERVTNIRTVDSLGDHYYWIKDSDYDDIKWRVF